MSFTAYTPRPGSSSREASFVFDTSKLDELKRNVAGSGDKDAEMEVARQFEALFIQQMLKNARSAAIPGGLWDSDQTKMVQGMNDEQLALQLASGKGMGLGDALYELMQANKAQIKPEELLVQAAPAAQPSDSASQSVSGEADLPANRVVVANSVSDLLESLGATVEVAIKAVKQTLAKIEPIKNASERVVAFVEKIGDAAIAAAERSGVPAALLMSQAALESGWGRREIKHPGGETSHNLFGIKATGGWTGKVVHITTTEYVDGVPRKMSQPFRAYDSYEDSIADYARLLTENPRYQKVMTASTARQAAQEVQKAGYATDPKYAQKLIQIMSNFEKV